MEVSSVALPSLPWTRLPTLTRWRLTRPAIGARTWVNSMLRLAAFSAPSACISAARAACRAWRRWSGIDDVEQIAGMDDRAVTEFNAGDEAADAGADLNFLHRLEAAGEFIPIGDGTFGRLCHRDWQWSGRRLRRRLVAATG